MAFNPVSPYNITYKQFTSETHKKAVVFDAQAYTQSVSVTGAPSWLNVFNIKAIDTQGGFALALKTNVTDNLSPGNYTAILTVTADLQEPDMISPETYSIGLYRVNLTVQETISLEITPSIFNFNHDPDTAAPPEKLLRITSENEWSIQGAPDWVTLTAASGSNSASVYVGVDPTSLTFGFYEAALTVNDGTATKTIAVYLTITTPATSTDFLYLNPQNLEFLSEKGQLNTVEKTIVVDASADFNVVSSENWLVSSIGDGSAGTFDMLVTVSSAHLDAGVYYANLTITCSGIVKKIYVSLRVVEYQVNGLTNNTLYFADDRNILSVGSVSDNSFLLLEIESSSEGETEVYQKSQPYFRGISKAVIGEETPALIPSIAPPTSFHSRITNNTQPMVSKITAYEEHRFTGYTPVVANYENLFFLKGKTPKKLNRASYIPERITVSNQALIQLSIISKEAEPQAHIIGEVISHTIQSAEADNKYLYSLFLNLAEYNFSHGDEFIISYAAKKITVQIDNDYTELNTLAFENEWGEFEFFETRGFLTIDAVVKQITTDRSEDGLTHTKILEAPEDATFDLNTGYIQTLEEVAWLSNVLYSKQVYLLINSEWLPVVLTTKKLEVYETRNHIHAYKLRFKKAVK